jgi:ribose-phosphate pyrophosphokinase
VSKLGKVIIPCSNAKVLGEKIASESRGELAEYETRQFPDGEIYVRIGSDLKGKEVIVVQAGYPRPNEALVELFLVLDACRELGAASVRVVMPYFPYSRQDKQFKEGEALSLKTIALILKELGVGKLITFDAHFRKGYGDYDLFGLDAVNLSAGPLLVGHVKEKYGDLFVISPDLGASELVKLSAEGAGCEYSKLSKKRSGDFEVSMEGELEVGGKSVLVLDDIISTGGTMKKAMEMAKHGGAEKVFAAATHGIFSADAMGKLKGVADYLVTTDSIENETSKVSLAGEVVKVL